MLCEVKRGIKYCGYTVFTAFAFFKDTKNP